MHPKTYVTLTPCYCNQATAWKTSTVDPAPADPMVHCEHLFWLSSMASAPYSLLLLETPHCSINNAYGFPSMNLFFCFHQHCTCFTVTPQRISLLPPNVRSQAPYIQERILKLLFYSPRREIPTSSSQRMALAHAQIIHLTASYQLFSYFLAFFCPFHSSSFNSLILLCTCYEI